MEITKDLLQKQLDKVVENAEGFKNGYITAFNWVLSRLEEKPTLAITDEQKGS